ncbi:hypothetical protein OROHE_014229 [Orobanche hederae]
MSKSDHDSLLENDKNYICFDVTSMVTLLVLIFEPMTMLQKVAEWMEYTYLLELVDECEDPHMRLECAETYELVNHGGITFIA